MPSCKNCTTDFVITDADRAFYTKLDVPEPLLCPNCRTQRRMAWRNERTFYPLPCGLCGKSILSMYSPQSGIPVYCRDCWHADSWEATSYGRPIDFSRPFFEQLAELQKVVPRVNTQVAGTIVNSDYCNYLGDAKDSYLCFGSIFIENCLFGNPYYSKDCVDSLLIRNCELCYQCVTSENLYSCVYCQDCFSSNNLAYCYDCRGCSECIGCAGLRNAHHCIFNTQYSEADYLQFKQLCDWCDPAAVQKVKRGLEQQKLKLPRRYLQGVSNVNVSGDYINESKNCHSVFDVKRAEDSAYCAQVIDLKDCYDNNYTEENELCYNYLGSWKNYRVLYSLFCYQCNDMYYSDACESSKNLFGCVVLRNKQFCILNTQYTEAEYYALRDKLIAHMKATGEWGEFFPVQSSPFAYNETVAQEYFPLTEAEIRQRGWLFRLKDAREYQPQTYQVPAAITAVPDSVVNEILACQQCGKNFKIIQQELAFYRTQSLPVPNSCPNCRHLARMALRNPRTLHHRQCMNTGCQNTFETTYSPDRPEKVYCEECYQKEIY